MKFWQKAFFCTLALFLVGFDLLGYIFAQRSFTLNREYALEAALTEQQVIASSIDQNFNAISPQFNTLNPNNLKTAFAPYAEYYQAQGVYLALYQDDLEVLNNYPAYTRQNLQGTEKNIAIQRIDGRLLCIIESSFAEPLDSLRLTYLKDIQSIEDFRDNMIYAFVSISIVLSLALSVVLLVLLLNLTRPFRKLNAAAAEISEGHYEKRVAVPGNDEIGEFAKSFNVMADNIEKHVLELKQMADSKETFINNFAHEIRTPITAVMGYAELLKIGNLSPEEEEKALDYVISQSNRIKNMMYKLMDLAYMKNEHIDHLPLDISAIINRAVATCTPSLKEKEIQIRLDLQPVTICGDPALMESLLQNLIENAEKASPIGGCIDIRTYNDKIIEITDYGKGMDNSEIAKITEPFYRIDQSRTRSDGGAGLGLALCARICEIHAAKLNIESENARGTKITISFTTP